MFSPPLTCINNDVEIFGRLLMAGIPLPSNQDLWNDVDTLSQILDWLLERLACHNRFVSVVLFGMHDCSGTVLLPMIGALENVKAKVAKFLDIQIGREQANLRRAIPALRQALANGVRGGHGGGSSVEISR